VITPAAVLADLTDSAELFHTADSAGYVALMIHGYCENWFIRGTRFRTWFRQQYYYKGAGSPLSAGAIGSALDLLEARAQFDAPRQDVYVRTAEHDGCIYSDLADELWRAVKITPDGWEVIIIPQPPVRFRRAAGMLLLPAPIRGGSIEALSSFLNLLDRNDFVLVIAWLLTALRHGGPYPLAGRIRRTRFR
jgi:hypothetical protein